MLNQFVGQEMPELQKKKEGERGTLGTGRITTTRRQKADPKKVAQGSMQQFLRRS